MNRRDFIRKTALTVATLAAARDRARAEPESVSRPVERAPGPGGTNLIDTHLYLSRWPYRRVPHDETPQLVRQLQRSGVSSAWAGSFDALLHRDIGAVNLRLAEQCAAEGKGLLVPFGAVNPTLPDWEDDIRRCVEVHRMPGIRLHPDFHGYALSDARFRRLLELATGRGLIVQIALGMEDPRTQAPSARLAPVNPGPLVELLPSFPRARVVLLNFFRAFHTDRDLLASLSRLPQVSFDLATVESVEGVQHLLGDAGSIRLLYGSFAPFYNFESSLLKLQESPLTPGQLAAIRHGNASALLRPA